jgi:hypothetical protein
MEDQDFLWGLLPKPLNFHFTAGGGFSFNLEKMGAPSATFAPYSAISAVADFAVTLARGPYKVLLAGARWARAFFRELLLLHHFPFGPGL